MTSMSAAWVKFFKDAGIPPDLSAKYAVMFCDHRIQKDMLADLDRDILSDIGVSAVGDKMAILKQAKFVAEQAKRDKTSKLLADGIKTLESRSNKPSSPASRMITHSINSRSPSQNSPKSSGDESKSVFQRLGEDSANLQKTGVFSRLGGDKAPASELPYAGVLKKNPATGMAKKKVSVKTKSKSTSVLDRLGEQKIEKSPNSNSPPPKITTNKLKVKKSLLLTKSQASSTASSPVTVKKSVTNTKLPTRKSNVLDRLGDIAVTSTTKQSPEKHEVAVKSPPVKPKMIIRVPKKQPIVRTLKRRSTGDMVTTPAKKPISSNTVSSTTSAGLFRGGAKESSSVFARLGKK